MNLKLLIPIIFSFISVVSKSQDTLLIYLDNNFSQVNKEKALYQREAIINNKRYYIKDMDMMGKVINYCEYKSVDPWIEDGTAEHYYEANLIYSTGKYVNGKISGKWIYYTKNKIADTVDYSVAENYVKSAIDIDLQKKTKKSTKNLNDSVIYFINSHFHFPARTRSKTDNFSTIIQFLLDTDGRAKYLDISNPGDDDVTLELLRIMLLHKNNYNIDAPMFFSLEFNHSEIAHLVVDEMPRFRTKDAFYNLSNLRQYVMNNLRLPSKDCKGKVYVQFEVNAYGKIDNTKVIRDIGNISACPGYIEEINRVMFSCPRWTPGKLNGVPVRVMFTLPIDIN